MVNAEFMLFPKEAFFFFFLIYTKLGVLPKSIGSYCFNVCILHFCSKVS